MVVRHHALPPASLPCCGARRSRAAASCRRRAPRRAAAAMQSQSVTSVTQLDASCPAEPLPGVSREVAALLAEEALVWSAQHGLTVAAAAPGTFTHAPLSLLPTPFSRSAFERAGALAAPFGDLVAAVAADADFLRATLSGACASDDFTARLMALFEATHKQRGDVELGLLRSDYMVDEPTGTLLQVEVNTIAASFACLSALTGAGRLHRHQVQRAGLERAYPPAALPENGALEGMAAGLAAGWKAAGNPDDVILVVVQPGERNVFDQQWIQSTLWRVHGIRTVRRTLAEVAALGSVGADGTLRVGDDTASLVYFRAGYTPNDYHGEAEWEGRALLERSAAVKCPSIGWHLAGSKKVQQELARPGVVERFLPADAAALVRASFAGLWALEGEGADAAIAAALADPAAFVLKPQREGGGNNLYGDELAARLRQRDGLGAFILMQRIRPPLVRALFMRAGVAAPADALCELGIYSVYLAVRGRVADNRAVGHLMRTKTSDSNEGGVAAGFAVLDSPLLV